MSHELRTPLNAILGFSEIMSQEMFGPLGNKKYTEYTGNIIDAGRHLLSLVNDILDLSRIELDTSSLVRQPIDIEAACRNCISIVRERAERGGIDLRLRVPGSMPAIQSDNRRLKQILINLLTNAIKFTPPGGSVSLDVEEDKSGYALFRIRDTGIGMSTEEIGKAGHPFWQADAGLDRTYEGTGLGLALVTKLASAMEGEFWLESTPGKGTTASLRLPRKLSAATCASIAAA
jgi:two-component system cell cycle sensor histidine kinase PleC